MDTSSVSQLPEFIVREYSGGQLEVECPRCSEEFKVSDHWTILKEVEGRPGELPAYPFGRVCPWCSRTSAIPADLRRFPDPEPPPAPKRRVVRRRRKV